MAIPSMTWDHFRAGLEAEARLLLENAQGDLAGFLGSVATISEDLARRAAANDPSALQDIRHLHAQIRMKAAQHAMAIEESILQKVGSLFSFALSIAVRALLP